MNEYTLEYVSFYFDKKNILGIRIHVPSTKLTFHKYIGRKIRQTFTFLLEMVKNRHFGQKWNNLAKNVILRLKPTIFTSVGKTRSQEIIRVVVTFF